VPKRIGKKLIKMIDDKDEAARQLDRSKQATEDVFESWIVDLTDQDQPDACSIDDEDCEACGS